MLSLVAYKMLLHPGVMSHTAWHAYGEEKWLPFVYLTPCPEIYLLSSSTHVELEVAETPPIIATSNRFFKKENISIIILNFDYIS